MNIQKSNIFIPQLNGFRGIAIGIVVVYHMALNSSFYPLKLISEGGWMAVQLFFILSGFLLSIDYIQSGIQNTKYTSASEFYKKRILRVFPLYVFSLLVYITYGFFHKSLPPLKELFLHFIFLQNISGTSHVYGPYWSLAIEVQMYLVFPLIGYIIYTTLSSGKTGRLTVFLCFLVSLPLLYRLFISELYSDLTNEDYILYIYQSILSNLDSFAWGIVGALIYVLNIPEKLSAKTGWLGLLISVFIIICLFDYSCSKGGWLLSQGIVAPAFFYTILNITWLLMIVSILILKDKWITVFFVNRWIGLLSLISYSMYVWHGLMLDFTASLAVFFSIEDDSYLIFFKILVSGSLILIVSYLSYSLIELPFQKMRGKSLKSIILFRN